MNTIINIKTDSVIKKKAQKIAQELGFSLSAVINAQLRDFVKNKSLSVSVEPELSPKYKKKLGRIYADIQAGKNLSGPFHTTDELIAHLNSL